MKKDILIYGVGKSGLAVEKFYKNKGITPILYDDIQKTTQIRNAKQKEGITERKNINFGKIKLAVVSPGISEFTSFYKKLQKEKIEIISEIELGFRNVKGKLIAITGTNGKTTTTSLIQHILKNNRDVYVAGNIGTPLISLSDKTKKKSIISCEVSSFQLMRISKFRPKISAILNLSPDHLTRHKNFKNYVKAKCNIFKNQRKRDYCILNYDDKLTKKLYKNISAKVYYFSSKNQFDNIKFNGTFLFNQKIYYKNNKKIKFIMNIEDINLIGIKNIENVLAAIMIVLLCKISVGDIKKGVKTFHPLLNRLERVKKTEFTHYINDSKSTNIASTLAALNAFDKNIVLMLGGSEKGENFKKLFQNIGKNVYKIIIYGDSCQHMRKCADDLKFSNYVVVKTFKEAFMQARKICDALSSKREENFLLLSPACASYDEFKNYEERGEMFRKLVEDTGEK